MGSFNVFVVLSWQWWHEDVGLSRCVQLKVERSIFSPGLNALKCSSLTSAVVLRENCVRLVLNTTAFPILSLWKCNTIFLRFEQPRHVNAIRKQNRQSPALSEINTARPSFQCLVRWVSRMQSQWQKTFTPSFIKQFLLGASRIPLSFPVIDVFQLSADDPEGLYCALTIRECKWHESGTRWPWPAEVFSLRQASGDSERSAAGA